MLMQMLRITVIDMRIRYYELNYELRKLRNNTLISINNVLISITGYLAK